MATKPPTVQIKPGKIIGSQRTLPNGSSTWYSYKGIPYAKPPVGHLRFKPPVPLTSFGGQTLNCTREGNVCLSNSYIPSDVAASEDCLFLNVYTPVAPAKAITETLPVMVWIHGGAFCTGSGDSSLYNPEYLVQEGVVVVTFNYRLGPLGFLCLPAVGIYGNMGLKDQQLVLKWVQENIRTFGGDKTNVTLFGESAGGASTHFHVLNEESTKYFHKAICQSGVATSARMLQTEPELMARRLATFIGCRGNTDQEIFEFLHYMSAEDISSKQKGALTEYEQTIDSLYPFRPVIESPESEQPFLTENILDLLKSPSRISIPLIVGINSEEAAYKANTLLNNMELYKNELHRFIPDSLDVPEAFLKAAASKILKFYTGHSEPVAEKVQDLTRIHSDNFYVMPTFAALEFSKKYNPTTPIYFYQFALEDELNKFRTLWKVPENFRGACHADDLCYLFSSSYFFTRAVKPASRAAQMRTLMCKLWTNFARTGNPTPPEDSELGFTWDPYESSIERRDAENCLQIAETVGMVKNPFQERLEFWINLYAKYNGSFLQPKFV